MHYVLFYEVADDYVTRRAPYRVAHLGKIEEAARRGEIVMAGALAEPIDGAMLIFREAAAAERFAATDPYVINGAVRSWKIRHWTTVIGDGAVSPLPGPPSDVPGRPEPSEYSEYAAAYVDLVEGGDIVRALTLQRADVLDFFRSITDEQAASTYAPGKWTIKQVLGHIIDTERIFTCRALCSARGETTPLPGFDQDAYVKGVDFDATPLTALLDEFRAVREASLSLHRNLSLEVWHRRGTAAGYSYSVRGLAFTSAGHERHHVKILRERYLR